MARFLREFRENDIDVFWFQRPCADIVNVSCPTQNCSQRVDVNKVKVEYTDAAPGFVVTQKGQFNWVHDMLKWPPGQLQRNMDRMEHWVERGVRGFYFDEADCDNLDVMLRAARSKWPFLFMVVEGKP